LIRQLKGVQKWRREETRHGKRAEGGVTQKPGDWPKVMRPQLIIRNHAQLSCAPPLCLAENVSARRPAARRHQLTGGIAHDFNKLLKMLDRRVDPARRQRLMSVMQQAAQSAAGLTRKLLVFSRRQDLNPEAVDIAYQIGGMREVLDRSLRGDVHVRFHFPETLWPVEVDRSELELVVLNLAVNARDAMPQGALSPSRRRMHPASMMAIWWGTMCACR
jgi:signal transduction histidine kinase